MKRKWQDTIKEEDYPTDVEDLTEDSEDMVDEDMERLDVDTLEDALIIAEECLEALNSLRDIISTHRPLRLHFLQQSITNLSQVLSQDGIQSQTSTTTSKSNPSQ